jgi:hypothetical protein
MQGVFSIIIVSKDNYSFLLFKGRLFSYYLILRLKKNKLALKNIN